MNYIREKELLPFSAIVGLLFRHPSTADQRTNLIIIILHLSRTTGWMQSRVYGGLFFSVPHDPIYRVAVVCTLTSRALCVKLPVCMVLGMAHKAHDDGSLCALTLSRQGKARQVPRDNIVNVLSCIFCRCSFVCVTSLLAPLEHLPTDQSNHSGTHVKEQEVRAQIPFSNVCLLYIGGGRNVQSF